MKKRKVYKGYINPDPSCGELPTKAGEVTTIKFGAFKFGKWTKADVKCTITVEWDEPK